MDLAQARVPRVRILVEDTSRARVLQRAGKGQRAKAERDRRDQARVVRDQVRVVRDGGIMMEKIMVTTDITMRLEEQGRR